MRGKPCMCGPCSAPPWNPDYQDIFDIDPWRTIANATESDGYLIVTVARFPQWQLFPLSTYEYSPYFYDNDGVFVAEVDASQTYRVFLRGNEISLLNGTRRIRYEGSPNRDYFVHPTSQDFFERTGSINEAGGGWVNVGNIDTVATAANGDNLYFAFASDAAGEDFTETYDDELQFIAVLRSETPLTPVEEDFEGLWKLYQPYDTPETLDTLPTFEFRALGEIIILNGVPSILGQLNPVASSVGAIITFPNFAQEEADVTFQMERIDCGCPHMIPDTAECNPPSPLHFDADQLTGVISIEIDASHGIPTYWNCLTNFWWGGEGAILRLMSVSGLLHSLGGSTAAGLSAVCEHETPDLFEQGSSEIVAFLHRPIPPEDQNGPQTGGFPDYTGYADRVWCKDERTGNVPSYYNPGPPNGTLPAFWNREITNKTMCFKKEHWKNSYTSLSPNHTPELAQVAGDTPTGTTPHQIRGFTGGRLVLDAAYGVDNNSPSNPGGTEWRKDGVIISGEVTRYLVIDPYDDTDAGLYTSHGIFNGSLGFHMVDNAWDFTVADAADVEVNEDDFSISYDYSATDPVDMNGQLSDLLDITFADVEALLALGDLGDPEKCGYYTLDLPTQRSKFQVSDYTGQTPSVAYFLHAGCAEPGDGDTVELTTPGGSGADLRFSGWPLTLQDVGGGTGYVQEPDGVTKPYWHGVVKDSVGAVKGGITVLTDYHITRTVVETYDTYDPGTGPEDYLSEREETSDAGSTPVLTVNPARDVPFAFGNTGPNQAASMVAGWGGVASCRMRQPVAGQYGPRGEVLVMKRSNYYQIGTTYYTPQPGTLYAVVATFDKFGVQISVEETDITESSAGITVEPPDDEGWKILSIENRDAVFMCHPGNEP